MARLIFIISNSATGKSSSLRSLKNDEVNYMSVTGKELPFQTDIKPFVPTNYASVIDAINKSTKPIVVLDDANYLMSFDEMNRSSEVGYQKFSTMARSFFDVIRAITNKSSDQNFYVMAHAQENEDGQLRIKTTGKMLSEKVVLEGLTNIVISAAVVDGQFVFKVATDGSGIKTPIGMFNTMTVPNDLKVLDARIRAYYHTPTTKPSSTPNPSPKPTTGEQ